MKVLFLILMDLCRRTAGLVHPLPVSQVGSNNIQVRLHYIDGNYTVLPEVVEASLGPHMQVVHLKLLPNIHKPHIGSFFFNYVHYKKIRCERKMFVGWGEFSCLYLLSSLGHFWYFKSP